MRKRPLADTEVGAIGLGCMGMSWGYAESRRDDAESLEVLRSALDLDVTLLDTAAVYGDGHNERLIGTALRGRRERPVVATKVGLVVDDLATRAMHRDGSPAAVTAAVERSLRRLGVDTIDLCYLHRVDPAVPLPETWGALAEQVRAGRIRRLGLSEVTVAQAEEAHSVFPVSAVQSELSVWTRDPLGDGRPDQDVVAWCGANGAAFVAFAPVGRGFLTGRLVTAELEASDFRRTNPRFTEEAVAANGRILAALRAVADRHGATPAQVALAWTLAAGEHVVPIPGTRRLEHLRENLAAADLVLGPDDLTQLDAVPAATGSRY